MKTIEATISFLAYSSNTDYFNYLGKMLKEKRFLCFNKRKQAWPQS